MYERMTPQQDLAVSKILQSNKKLSFKAATQSVNNGDTDYDSSFSKEHLQIFEEVDCWRKSLILDLMSIYWTFGDQKHLITFFWFVVIIN